MSNDLFAAEKKILEQAEQHLDAADLAPEAFAALLKGYEKLLKRTRRLVKMSDRSEAEIRRLSDEQSILNSILSEQNGKLEALSTKLSKYLSPQVYESIFSGKAEVRVGADRKFLTVFFSDIASFTEITDQLEPEILTRSLNAYLNEMAQIAIANGATIDKYIGDAVMAFFGDPETEGPQEDARRCIAMAMAMQSKTDQLNVTLRTMGVSRPFRIRCGIKYAGRLSKSLCQLPFRASILTQRVMIAGVEIKRLNVSAVDRDRWGQGHYPSAPTCEVDRSGHHCALHLQFVELVPSLQVKRQVTLPPPLPAPSQRRLVEGAQIAVNGIVDAVGAFRETIKRRVDHHRHDIALRQPRMRSACIRHQSHLPSPQRVSV